MAKEVSSQVEEVSFHRKMGKNMPNLISRLASSGTISSIEELGANAYDADANNFHITYDKDRDLLIVEDDGSGMTREDLGSFFQLGDSPKLREPVSPSGRRRIGKFGVATILLSTLCAQYKLDTEKNGTRTLIRERIPEEITSERPIKGIEKKVKDSYDYHGTKILMTGLKLDSDFSLKKLKRRVQWELPILPDFRVYINGEEVSSKSIEKATTFSFDFEGKKMGSAKGKIHLTNSPTPLAGIYVYVNGRAVGDPQAMLQKYIGSGKLTLMKRTIGLVEADGLEDAIIFDRRRFREGHPALLELDKGLTKAISQIRGYVERMQNSSYKTVENRKEKIAEEVASMLRGRGILDRGTTIKFEPMKEQEPGKYEEKLILLNPDYPGLTTNHNTNSAQYQRAVMQAIVEVISIDKARNSKGTLIEFLQRRTELLGKIMDSHAKKEGEKEKELHPSILYTPSQLSNFSGRSISAIRYLIDGGALPREDEGVKGDTFTEFLKGVKGLVTLPELVQEKNGFVVANSLDKFNKILSRSETFAKPFIHRVGRSASEENKAYLAESAYGTKLWELFKSPDLDLRSDTNPAGVFMQLHDSLYNLTDLVKESDGLNIREVAQVIDYSKRRGLKLRKEKSGGQDLYYLGEFVSALQSFRGNLIYGA